MSLDLWLSSNNWLSLVDRNEDIKSVTDFAIDYWSPQRDQRIGPLLEWQHQPPTAVGKNGKTSISRYDPIPDNDAIRYFLLIEFSRLERGTTRDFRSNGQFLDFPPRFDSMGILGK